jgi:hypothetical protein
MAEKREARFSKGETRFSPELLMIMSVGKYPFRAYRVIQSTPKNELSDAVLRRTPSKFDDPIPVSTGMVVLTSFYY